MKLLVIVGSVALLLGADGQSVERQTRAAAVDLAFGRVDFPREAYSAAFRINDRGHITGGYGPDFKTLNFANHAFLLKADRFRILNFPAATHTVAVGINQGGDIVGGYLNNNLLSDQHAFIRSGGIYTNIDVPGATYTFAVGINIARRVVGYYGDTTGNDHGFLWSNGTLTTIDAPGATFYTFALGINTADDIVGVYGDAAGHEHGFLLKNGVFTTIDFPGATDTAVYDLNDKGQMVGGYGINELVFGGLEPHGFVFSGGQFTAFDVPFAGAVYTNGTGINNKGKIVGRYTDANAFDFGFIATITP